MVALRCEPLGNPILNAVAGVPLKLVSTAVTQCLEQVRRLRPDWLI